MHATSHVYRAGGGGREGGREGGKEGRIQKEGYVPSTAALVLLSSPPMTTSPSKARDSHTFLAPWGGGGREG